MVERQRVVIDQLSENEAQQRSFYRLMHNKGVASQAIKHSIYADCKRQVEAGQHYLVIQDTTQPNFEGKGQNSKDQTGLGVIGHNKDLGFFWVSPLFIEG